MASNNGEIPITLSIQAEPRDLLSEGDEEMLQEAGFKPQGYRHFLYVCCSLQGGRNKSQDM